MTRPTPLCLERRHLLRCYEHVAEINLLLVLFNRDFSFENADRSTVESIGRADRLVTVALKALNLDDLTLCRTLQR